MIDKRPDQTFDRLLFGHNVHPYTLLARRFAAVIGPMQATTV